MVFDGFQHGQQKTILKKNVISYKHFERSGMTILRYLILILTVIQSSTAQDSLSFLSKISNDIYDSFAETVEWYDVPIFITDKYSHAIFGSNGELQIFKITPFAFEKEFNRVIGETNRHSIGSLDKDIFPHLLIASRLGYTLGQTFILNEKFDKTHIKHTLIFYKSLVYTNLVTEIFKGLIHKQRPDNSDSRSFFSGHSSTTFAASTFIYREVKDFLESWEVTQKNEFLKNSFTAISFAGLYGWSSYVGLSRMRDNKHYLADVLIGAAVGTLISNFVYDKYFGKSPNINADIKIDQTYDVTYLGFTINF